MDAFLYDIARQGHPVVTVNKRLARFLSQQYDLKQREAGLLVWPRPCLLPFSAWLNELWLQAEPSHGMLTEAQEQHVWETLIKASLDPFQQRVMQVPATARKAREAHRLLRQYQIDPSPAEAAEDHRMFLQWRQGWLEAQKDSGSLERANLPHLVTEMFRAGHLQVPSRLVLAGFDELTPDLTRLIQTLTQSGCQVDEWHAPGCSEAQRIRVACIDIVDEVAMCARWVRGLLQQGCRNVGVVAPNLNGYRALLSSTFTAELDPVSLASPDPDRPEPFAISLGRSLADEGLIRSALRLLKVTRVLTFDDVSLLLRCRHIAGSQDELQARAGAERRLRETGATTWTLQQLRRRLNTEQGVASLCQVVDQLIKYSSRERLLLPGDWAAIFTSLLEACSWPGEGSLSSREYQAVRHFKEILLALASLDRVAKPMTRTAAVGILGRFASEMVFQPEAPESPVQILGLLEASGIQFDALWVLGMHDRAMPAPANPNPFIPLPLQRRLAMPHADAERERQFADRVCGRLFNAAPSVIASYPKQFDNAECRPSPYLTTFHDARLELVDSVDPRTHMNRMAPVLETLFDSTARPLQTRKPFSGGTGLIKDQALCPFRAFAHHRLRAKGLDTPDVGIDRMSRGTLTHKMLELFWREVASQDELLAMTEEDRARLLAGCAEQALLHLEKSQRLDFPPVIRRQEVERLSRQGREWLEVELKRPPFAIHELEKLHVEQVGKLQIRTKVDRIDLLPDNSLVIIDYKTGLPDPAKWAGERIAEPQLPIYCLSRQNQEVGAVSFAIVRPGDCRFRGLARNPDSLPGLSTRTQDKWLTDAGLVSFDEILQQWDTVLPALGDAFASGHAMVDPVDLDEACRYCDLTALCRIHERYAVAAGEAEDD